MQNRLGEYFKFTQNLIVGCRSSCNNGECFPLDDIDKKDTHRNRHSTAGFDLPKCPWDWILNTTFWSWPWPLASHRKRRLNEQSHVGNRALEYKLSRNSLIFTAVLLFACKEVELPYVTAEPNMQSGRGCLFPSILFVCEESVCCFALYPACCLIVLLASVSGKRKSGCGGRGWSLCFHRDY